MTDLCLRSSLETEKNQTNSTSQYKNNKSSTENANSLPYYSTMSLCNSEYMIYNKESLPSEEYEFYPKILHIPSSITCQNDFSWGLWNWIHSKDSTSQESVYSDRYPSDDETITFTRILTPESNTFTLRPSFDHHPKHYHIERNNIPTPKSEAIANKNSSSLNQYVNTQSSPNNQNLKGISPTTIPRFYIQVFNFKGEHYKNVSSICCSIEIDNNKVFTGIVPCIKNNDGTITAHFNEAFVFDVTSMNFTVHISIYGLYHKVINKSFIRNIKETLNIKNDSSKALKPSYTGIFRNYHLNSNDLCHMTTESVSSPKNSPLNRSISILSNTFALKKSQCKKDSVKNPMENIDLTGKEIFIGDLEMYVAVKKLDKMTNSYKLKPITIQSTKNNGPPIIPKYQQSIVIQSGIYMDEKVKETISYINENIYCDFLNVQLSTTTVPVWKRYWVIFKENFLTFYDFEYKERKEPLGKIDIHTLKLLDLPNPEFNSMPNCFFMEFLEDKDLTDIVGVYQKEGDYNEKDNDEELNQNKYARIKPKEELLLKKEVLDSQQDVSNSNSNINSNNTLYSSNNDGLNDKEDKEENKNLKLKVIPSIVINDDEVIFTPTDDTTTEEKKDETLNSLDNVAINIDTIENMIKNMDIKNNVDSSNNTLHQQQEKIPYYEWINRVVTKSTAYFYADSPSKLTQWMKIIEESPCFRIDKK